MNRLIYFFLCLPFITQASATDVRPLLRQVMEEIKSTNCAEKMDKVERTFTKLNSSDYQQEFTSQKAENLGKEIWDFKILVHEKLRSFYKDQKLSQDCANAYRGALRAVRYAEDLVQEHQVRNNSEKLDFPATAFAENNPHVKRNPKYENFNLKSDLKSGDIILSRGNAYTSAAIASLGEFDTQFSHLSLVYVDPQGKIWTVEAHIEVGSFVRPLEDHIDDKNPRTMIFRYDDPEVAKRAAEFIFKKVKAASESRSGNILYDFAFDPVENTKLFCSEIISYSYDQASSGQVMLPAFKSRLFSRKESFVKDIGITADESFIPADMEVDPRFEVIAEWRDANRIKDSMEKDAVLQAMYSWVDDYGYRMVQGSSKKSFQYRNIAWPLRRVPFLKRYFVKKMPLNMSRELIGYFGVLESTAELLHKELIKANDLAIKERGSPLLREEMYSVLEGYRVKDLTFKGPLHKMFRRSGK